MDSQLLVTKIIVPTPRAVELRRPRLLDFIHEYIDRKLLLIAASAGYGKTSLLTDFAHDTALPVCWYSLDASDADPHAFLSYLVAAIQLRFPHFGGRTQALLERFDASSLDALVGALVQDLYTQIDSFFVLVLDDYHTVEDSEPVNRVLDRLLGYLPENVHLILASRTIPSQLTLTRLTAQRQVAGIGVGDLRFTAEEVRALMQQQRGLDMPAPEAHELAIRSEGWIAGIILTTPDFWRGLFELQVGGAGPGTQLFEYLATQVLSQQPPELHRFLLESSVLPEMYPAWCDEICGRADAAALLDLAERRNLFITRLQDHGYRFHNLFREFLAAQLRQTQPARRRELEQRVAALYERHGKLDQAVDQWLAVEEYDAAARILEITAQEHYELGRWTALARRLNALPDAVLETHPALQRQRAILLAESGDTQRAQLCFESAARVLEHRGDSLNLARTLIESARYVNDVPEGIAICERALALLPRREFALHALACRTMGVLQARADDFSRAIPLFERASGLYEIANDRALQADAESGLGGVYLDVGDRARATLHLNKALMYWRNLGLTSKLANTLNSIGIARYQEGRLDEGHDLLQEALTNAQASGHLKIEAYVHASLGEVYRDQGDLVRALQSFSQAADLAEKIRERYLITFARVAIGDVWRLSGDLGTAERVLQTAFQAASAHHSDYQIALVQVAMAALRLAQGETGSAVRHLDQALPLLEQPHAKRDLARAHLYRAVAAQRRGHVGQALIHLRRVAAIGKALGESQFLACDVGLAQPSVELALTRRVGVTFYKKVKQLAPIPVALVNVSELAPAFPQLELQVLGHSRVLMNGRVIEKSDWQTAATKELFLFFATQPRGWRKEQVIEQIWPNMLRRQGSDLFHSTLYRVRRALFPECLTFHNGLYQINAEVVRCMDENEFVTAVAEGGQAEQPLDRIDALERAVKLYRGDFLDDIYSDWCIPRRDQLLQRYLDALALIAQSWTELGDVSQAVSYYRRILRREPLHEATYCKLIELYARSGDRTSAVQTYQQCVSMLASELGVPPMPETQALYRRCVEYA